MKLSKVPDLSARFGLVARPDQPGAGAGAGPVEQLLRAAIDAPALVDYDYVAGATPEQRAMALAKRSAVAILESRPRVRQAVAAMLAIRRCYAVAYRELQDALESVPEVGPMDQDLMVQSAMHQAARPFEGTDLLQGLVDSVLPWVAAVVERHIEEEEAARAVEREVLTGDRLSCGVPVGFLLDLDATAPELPRGSSLTLAGPIAAVAYALERVVEAALAAGQCVLRLAGPGDHEESAAYTVLGPDEWNGACNTNAGLARALGRSAAHRLDRPVDLLVCDDLALAHTVGYAGRPVAASGGDAHRRLLRWAVAAGAALVGGLPDDETDLRSPAFEQLRTFSSLRGVQVEEGPEGLRVAVVPGLHFWPVPAGESL